jgi:predicted hydrolase (HD superfamily)
MGSSDPEAIIEAVPAGIGRLELFIVLRNQLADRALVQRALAVEAVMEDLAVELGADTALWALAGLGADIDAKLAAHNPDRRGAVAEELLLAEGVAAGAAAAARQWRHGPAGELPDLAQALAGAEWLVDAVGRARSDPDVDLRPELIAHHLRRAARRDEPEARRVTDCLAALGLSPGRAAEIAIAAHLRVREDLGW